MNELELIIKRLNILLDMNQENIYNWLNAPNKHLHYATPMDYVQCGFGYKVLSLIDNLKENK